MKSLLKCYEAVGDGKTDGGGANKKVGRVKHTRCHRVNSVCLKSGGQICKHAAARRLQETRVQRTDTCVGQAQGNLSSSRRLVCRCGGGGADNQLRPQPRRFRLAGSVRGAHSDQRVDMCGSDGLWESWYYELGRTAAG